jgi:hypothetical protein
MHCNQSKFEIARDICILTEGMVCDETIQITLTRVMDSVDDGLYNWESSIGEVCGSAEQSDAIRKAYMENR